MSRLTEVMCLQWIPACAGMTKKEVTQGLVGGGTAVSLLGTPRRAPTSDMPFSPCSPFSPVSPVVSFFVSFVKFVVQLFSVLVVDMPNRVTVIQTPQIPLINIED